MRPTPEILRPTFACVNERDSILWSHENILNSLQCGFDQVGDVEEILRIYRRAEAHLCWPRQRADYQHRAAFMRNNFAAPLDLQRQSAGLRFDPREVVNALD